MVVLSIILVGLTGLAERGVAIVGTIPAGLPALGIPAVSLGDATLVFPLALGLFVLSFVELSTIARNLREDPRVRGR